jgi:proline racemase
MALRYTKGMQKLHEEFVSESIIGSLFYGRLVEETSVGPYVAVVPTVRGSAYISGIQQFVLDPRDPWPEGFYLGESSKWGAEF